MIKLKSTDFFQLFYKKTPASVDTGGKRKNTMDKYLKRRTFLRGE